jgi:DNA-binding Xre family transcriptional regulator
MKNRLEIFLLRNSLTSAQLSLETGINKDTISKIKRNKIKKINIENISKLCNYFNCKLEDMFYIENKGE